MNNFLENIHSKRKYGNNLLNKVSKEFNDLKNIFSISILSSVFVEGGFFAFEGLAGLSLGAAMVITIPLFIVLFPNETNELWKDFMYLLNPNYKEYLDITIPENTYNVQYSVSTTNVLLNTNSDLNTLLKSPDFDKKLKKNQIELIALEKHGHDAIAGAPSPIEGRGEKLRIAYEHAKLCWKAGNYVEFLKNWLIMDFILASSFAEIIDAWGEEIIDLLTGLENTSKG